MEHDKDMEHDLVRYAKKLLHQKIRFDIKVYKFLTEWYKVYELYGGYRVALYSHYLIYDYDKYKYSLDKKIQSKLSECISRILEEEKLLEYSYFKGEGDKKIYEGKGILTSYLKYRDIDIERFVFDTYLDIYRYYEYIIYDIYLEYPQEEEYKKLKEYIVKCIERREFVPYKLEIVRV